MLNQKDIDAPGRYFQVAETTLPAASRVIWNKESYHAPGEFIDGDRSECIPGESIISILRKQSQEQGKPVTIKETHESRWPKFIAKWFLALIAITFLVGVLVSVAKADEVVISSENPLVYSLLIKKVKGCPPGYYCVPKVNLEGVVEGLNIYSRGIEKISKTLSGVK